VLQRDEASCVFFLFVWPHSQNFVEAKLVKLFRSLEELPEKFRSGAVTVGNFDGVHRGHARLVERLLAAARRVGGPALVFTFDPHPVRLLRPEQCPPPLTWTDRKAQLLAELGVDATLAYPTDRRLLELSPREFFNHLLREQLDAKALVEGPNFYFGRDRAGDVQLLEQYCREAGISLEVVPALVENGQTVSSSRVRTLIAAGHIDEATALLTRPYRIRGMVVHGAGRGAQIGFPTANIGAIDTLLPGPGVYAGRLQLGQETWPAAINVGPNPTFGEQALKVEVHAIGYHGSLYGEAVEVDFLSRLRDIRSFEGVDALRAQLAKDVAEAQRIAAA
jgi:riboflavin kinase/FMN adenylyltransferase